MLTAKTGFHCAHSCIFASSGESATVKRVSDAYIAWWICFLSSFVIILIIVVLTLFKCHNKNQQLDQPMPQILPFLIHLVASLSSEMSLILLMALPRLVRVIVNNDHNLNITNNKLDHHLMMLLTDETLIIHVGAH